MFLFVDRFTRLYKMIFDFLHRNSVIFCCLPPSQWLGYGKIGAKKIVYNTSQTFPTMLIQPGLEIMPALRCDRLMIHEKGFNFKSTSHIFSLNLDWRAQKRPGILGFHNFSPYLFSANQSLNLCLYLTMIALADDLEALNPANGGSLTIRIVNPIFVRETNQMVRTICFIASLKTLIHLFLPSLPAPGLRTRSNCISTRPFSRSFSPLRIVLSFSPVIWVTR